MLYTQFDAMETAIAKLQNELNVINNIYYIAARYGSSTNTPATSSGKPEPPVVGTAAPGEQYRQLAGSNT